ncbi:MAG: hypothetical protein HDR57_00305 [Treponema sp.]|nr:hypothetical protein [Treponema sp.]
MSKLAVTGITGKSGQFFWKELLSNESLVREKWQDGINLLSRNVSKLDNMKKGKIDTFFYELGGMGDAVTESFCKDCDTLVHIAGIHWTLPLLKIAVATGVKRVILVHTTGIYSKYKAAGEEYRNIDAEVYRITKDNNIALSILRPTMIYGDISDKNVAVFIRMVDKLRIMPTVNGAHYELQPVHCKDLGKAYYSVLMNPEICNGKDYILSGGAPVELRQMFEEIAKNLGVKRTYVSCPFEIAYFGAWVIYLLTLTRKDYREKVQRLVEPRVYSHENAAKDFGYNPMTFEEGIVDEVKQYLKNK